MRHPVKLSAAAVAVSLAVAACGGSAYKSNSSASSTKSAARSGASAAVVKTASNATLGTILVDAKGITLYRLSGEGSGKFICTSSECLGLWHPLTVSSGGAPTGQVSSLGTVKRPDGSVQVTYKGEPLYTFAEDKQPGETNGQGFKDVGTWNAVSVSSTGAAAGGGQSEPSTSGAGGAYEESGEKYGY